MKSLGRMKIGTRLILMSAALVVVVFAATVIVTIVRVNRMTMDDAAALAAATAGSFGQETGTRLSGALAEAHAIADVFRSVAGTGDAKLTREEANAILKGFIEKNTQFLDVYVAFEPNAFDGKDAAYKGKPGHDQTGRFIPCWSRDTGGRSVVEALRDYETKGAGDYYLIPKDTKREAVIEPYTYDLNGRDVLRTSLVVPIVDRWGVFLGVAGIDVALDSLEQYMKTAKIGAYRDAYADIYTQTGIVAASPDESWLGKMVEETTTDKAFIAAVKSGKPFVLQRSSAFLKGRKILSAGSPILIGSSGASWMANANIPIDELTVEGTRLMTLLGGIAVVFVVVIIGMQAFIARGIVRPIGKGVDFARRIADGDLTATLDAGSRQDEIGALTEALNAMRNNLRDLTRQIQDGALQLASSSEEISASAQHLSEGAQTQASTLEETSASIEELTASVEQVSNHAQSQSSSVTETSANMDAIVKSVEEVSSTLEKVAATTGHAVERAQAGEKSVEQAIEAIKNISMSSERISGIVGVIGDIADQTNLLALNASIEAARAGEHGRGFAVVADEVSKLADRSATSTKEIAALIQQTLKQVKAGVDLAEGSGRSMQEIIAGASDSSTLVKELRGSIDRQVAAIKRIAKAVENLNEMSQGIAAAAEEQTANSRQVSKAIESVNDITQQAASSAEEMASSVEEMSSMAQQLQGLVARFKFDAATEAAPVQQEAVEPPLEA